MRTARRPPPAARVAIPKAAGGSDPRVAPLKPSCDETCATCTDGAAVPTRSARCKRLRGGRGSDRGERTGWPSTPSLNWVVETTHERTSSWLMDRRWATAGSTKRLAVTLLAHGCTRSGRGAPGGVLEAPRRTPLKPRPRGLAGTHAFQETAPRAEYVHRRSSYRCPHVPHSHRVAIGSVQAQTLTLTRRRRRTRRCSQPASRYRVQMLHIQQRHDRDAPEGHQNDVRNDHDYLYRLD